MTPFLSAGAAAATLLVPAAAVAATPEAQSSPQAAGFEVLLSDWDGAYGGVPPFDRVETAMFEPALEEGMKRMRAEIDAITASEEPAGFENTILAMETAGKALSRARTAYGIWSTSLNDAGMQAIQLEMAPRLAAFSDSITQNEALFERIEAVYEGDGYRKLDPEQQRLVWDYYTDFVRAGAKLGPEQKQRVAEINRRLATLYTTFSNNLLHDEQAYVTWLSAADIEGLPGSVIAAAASAAGARGNEGGEYAILNTRSSMDPFLTYSGDRGLREKVWRAYYSRGDNGDEYDNDAVIVEIMKLRDERTGLQGYASYADRALEKSVAGTPAAAMALMTKVWPAATAKVESEVAAMQAIVESEGGDFAIQPWDYRYYAEKARQAKYAFDAEEVKQYLQLEKLREGMFWMARQLYGLEFAKVDDVPVFHEDVRVWKVTRDGKPVGLWYFDPYAREGKRSGAWMSGYRVQDRIGADGFTTPIVSNNSNFVEGGPGEPVLVSWDDATTLFHEFGHALHGLNSDVTYPSLAGTAVPRDYVEFPSQVHENWLPTPEVLNRFALHVKTGEPIPAALVRKIEESANARQGFDTVEYLASALVDMALHRMTDFGKFDPDSFERETLEALRMPDELPMRHRLPQFAHIFSGEGYAAGYYAYLWSETFAADAWEAFEEAGGPYDEETAARFRKWVLSVGNSTPPPDAYAKFRGRAPDPEALMRDRGFASGVKAETG